MENHKIITQSGDCKTRHTPCSTFKIAISLMGYNERFLTDESHPELPFKKEYADDVETWKQAQTPTSWIKKRKIIFANYLEDETKLDYSAGKQA